MKIALGKLALGAVLAASAAITAVPAQARDSYRHHRDGGDDAAIAIGAGVVGLALGAALASDRRDRYYDDYYYDDGYYYGRPRVYYSRPYPRNYYYNYNSYPRNYYRYDRRGHRGWNHGHGRGGSGRGYYRGW